LKNQLNVFNLFFRIFENHSLKISETRKRRKTLLRRAFVLSLKKEKDKKISSPLDKEKSFQKDIK